MAADGSLFGDLRRLRVVSMARAIAGALLGDEAGARRAA